MLIPVLLRLALFLTLLPAAGQMRGYSVQGVVTIDGLPIGRSVVVYLEELSARPTQQTLTDGFGNFSFQDVLSGTYYVRVKEEGFEETAQRINLPEYNRDVALSLQRKASTTPPVAEFRLGTEYQVDIRQLSIPENALREYQKALDEDKHGNTSSAIRQLRQALKLAPNFIEAAFRLGSALYKVGHFEDAEDILKKALQIAPKEPHLHLMLANIFVKEGKYEQALSEIDSYLKDNPAGAERISAERTRSQLIRAIEK